jgi:hypothetical protein
MSTLEVDAPLSERSVAVIESAPARVLIREFPS